MRALSRLIHKHRQSRPRIQFQVMSDLHLEVGQQYPAFEIPAAAPYLVLAGDIGRLVDYDNFRGFLQRMVPQYKRVFLVLGNHEFYGLNYDSAIEKAQALVDEPSLQGKVTLLHKTLWSDPDSDLTVLGCTLWSAIPETAHEIVSTKISDFKKIDGWTVERHNQIHAEEAAWLREQVQQITDDPNAVARQLLVVTHHAPSLDGTSSPEHVGNPWAPAFATNLLKDKVWKRVHTWVFGHTHYTTDFVRNGIRIVSNQRGYVFPGSALGVEATRSSRVHTFDSGRIIEI